MAYNPQFMAKFGNKHLLFLPTALLDWQQDFLTFAAKEARGEKPEPRAFLGSSQNPAQQNLAIVNIEGPLIGSQSESYWGQTYSGLSALFNHLAQDTSVSRVLIRFNSPGGELIGYNEARAALLALAATKPVTAHIETLGCSAAYGLASAANTITIAEDAIAGSIGVIMVHYDYSKAYEGFGITPTLIFAGENKAEGTSLQPLPEETRQKFQAECEDLRKAFAAPIAASRKMPLSKILAQEAETYRGKAAVAAGLADKTTTFEAIKKELSMSTETDSHAAALASAREDAAKAAVKDERTRVSAITSASEAKMAGKTANVLIELGISAADAKMIFAAIAEDFAMQTLNATFTSVEPAAAGKNQTLTVAQMEGLAERMAVSVITPAATPTQKAVNAIAEKIKGN